MLRAVRGSATVLFVAYEHYLKHREDADQDGVVAFDGIQLVLSLYPRR
jgi:hypothetical protein